MSKLGEALKRAIIAAQRSHSSVPSKASEYMIDAQSARAALPIRYRLKHDEVAISEEISLPFRGGYGISSLMTVPWFALLIEAEGRVEGSGKVGQLDFNQRLRIG